MRSTSSIRSMNSWSIRGTHYIFFPPRLEVVGCKNDANGFAAYLRRDSSFDDLLGCEANRPSRSTFRRRSADHRDDRRFLDAVEPLVRLAARLVGERGLQPTRDVALSNPGYFARVRSNCLGSRSHRQTFLEQLQNSNSAPGPR